MTRTDQPSRRLRDVVTLEKGKPPAQQPYFQADAERYLTPDYLRGGGSVELVKLGANAVRVSDGDTIVLWDGSNAGEVMRGRAGVLASTMTRALHGIEFDGGYFFYALKRWEWFLKGQTSGSGIPHVDNEILGNLRIIQFEQAEQTKIAEILWTVDRAIEQTKTLIAKQQRIKTGLMQDFFTLGIDEHGNLRSEQSHEFMDSPLGRAPRQWSIKTLAKATSKLITYGIVQPGAHVPEGIPFVQTKDLFNGVLDIERMDRTSREIHSAYERSAIHAGDVLVGIRASVGSVVITPQELDGMNISRGVARLSPSSDVIPKYLFWALQSSRTRNSIALEVKGSTYPEITLPALRNVLVPVPPPREQELIANGLDRSATQLTQTEAELSKLVRLKTGLMLDLLDGKRRVTVLLRQAEQKSA